MNRVLYLSFILFFIGYQAVVASTSKRACPLCSTSQLATFEDLAAFPLGVTDVTSQGIPVPYKELSWEAFGVVSTTPGVGRLRFHSPPNAAVSGVRRELTTGQKRTITTTYPNAKVKSFDLNSFYMACVENTQGTLNLPVACDVQVTGYRVNMINPSICDVVGPENVNFNPPTITGSGGITAETTANMTQHIFPNTFHDLKNVTIEIVNFLGDPALGVLVLDDVAFKTHSTCCP